MSRDTPVPQFPRLPNGDDNITHPKGLLWGADESRGEASLAGTYQAQHKPSFDSSHKELALHL